MSEEKGGASGLTRAEQIKAMMPMLRKYMPQITEIAILYNKTYPVASTPPEVVNAVTVSVPLRHFMLLSAVCTNLTAADIERELAENAELASGARSA